MRRPSDPPRPEQPGCGSHRAASRFPATTASSSPVARPREQWSLLRVLAGTYRAHRREVADEFRRTEDQLHPTRASLQMSTFVEEVMSHLRGLSGAHVEMTLEVQVNVPGGIDEQTARIVLENSAALNVDQPGLY